MDAAAARAALDHYLRHSAARDEETAHSIYAEDAVLEFPQSGERFEGVGKFPGDKVAAESIYVSEG